MLTERLQILITAEQRRRLQAEAARRGTSVGSLIREAVDARYGTVAPEDRLRAVRDLAAMGGRFLTPEEIERVVSEERDGVADAPR